MITGIVPGHASSGDVRLAELCSLLSSVAAVDLVAIHAGADGPDAADRDRLAVLGVRVVAGAGVSALRRALLRRPYDLVLVEFWFLAELVSPILRRAQPWATIVVDSVDLHLLREERGERTTGEEEPGEGGRLGRRRRELAAYQAADVVVFCTEDDREHFLAIAEEPGATVVITNLLRPRERPTGRRLPVVVFVGNFWHPPNRDAAAWMVEAVWPAVLALHADAELLLVGAHPDARTRELADRPGVRVTGYVDDLDALYDRTAVAVVPVRFGAGMKGKLCEALIGGVPVVSTSCGAEGLALVSGRDLLVADDAEEFAAAVVALIADPALGHRLGLQGRQAVAEVCAPERWRPAVVALVADARDRAVRLRPTGMARLLQLGAWRVRASLGVAGRRVASTVARA